jgi:hypothetical protein
LSPENASLRAYPYCRARGLDLVIVMPLLGGIFVVFMPLALSLQFLIGNTLIGTEDSGNLFMLAVVNRVHLVLVTCAEILEFFARAIQDCLELYDLPRIKAQTFGQFLNHLLPEPVGSLGRVVMGAHGDRDHETLSQDSDPYARGKHDREVQRDFPTH